MAECRCWIRSQRRRRRLHFSSQATGRSPRMRPACMGALPKRWRPRFGGVRVRGGSLRLGRRPAVHRHFRLYAASTPPARGREAPRRSPPPLWPPCAALAGPPVPGPDRLHGPAPRGAALRQSHWCRCARCLWPPCGACGRRSHAPRPFVRHRGGPGAMEHAESELLLCRAMPHTGPQRLPERPSIGPWGKAVVEGRVGAGGPWASCGTGKHCHGISVERPHPRRGKPREEPRWHLGPR
jgi:hypothetical protein